MGDFPAVRQLVAQAVSPVLAGAPSPAPAPPLYPLPLDAARLAATTAAADAMDGVPPVSMEGRRVRNSRRCWSQTATTGHVVENHHPLVVGRIGGTSGVMELEYWQKHSIKKMS